MVLLFLQQPFLRTFKNIQEGYFTWPRDGRMNSKLQGGKVFSCLHLEQEKSVQIALVAIMHFCYFMQALTNFKSQGS